MKLFCAALMHETSRFSPLPTNVESCKESIFYLPEQDPSGDKVKDIELYGEFVALLRSKNHQVVVGPAFGAQPSGLFSGSDYRQLRDRLLLDLKSAGNVDAVVLFLHGAQMARGYDDCEGDLLRRVRKLVGADVPVGAVLDLHGNLSDQMLEAATLLVAGKEYPHSDYPERILELMELLERTVRGEVTPVMRRSFIPVLGSFHTTREALRSFVKKVISLEKGPVLSISMMHGFPWSDTSDTGANMLVITDGRAQCAERLAATLAVEFSQICRQVGVGFLLGVEEALDRAQAINAGPVVIADVADNAGGGAPSDSTFILRAMLGRNIGNAALGMIWDPMAVQIAVKAGVGATLPMRIGGKTAEVSGDPLDIEA